MAIATMHSVVLDCPDPRRLAEFYAQVLGGKIEPGDDNDWVDVTGPDGHKLAFQESPGFIPPQWPSLEHAQQLHLDLQVPRERMDQAEQDVIALGARRIQGDDDGKLGFRVYLDPAGHPFCLCVS
ncbi:VOC family protein [Streptomyces ovatisporus]|uniref:VOC family protein n=1 Tax=Streptomyces ovatisporus TaxID=1128682 RepID=A0ABV9A4N1_9ACTN